MQLLESVEEMRQAAANLYGPRGWQRALQFAVRAVRDGNNGMTINAEDGEMMDARWHAMNEYIARGDAFNMLDLMIEYGWSYTDVEGHEWSGRAQNLPVLSNEE